MKDPKKLRDQKPDYVKDVSGTRDPDHQPQVGTDPMSLPQQGEERKVIAPDPEKVAKADRERAKRDEDDERDR
jgi:hypothetical protein